MSIANNMLILLLSGYQNFEKCLASNIFKIKTTTKIKRPTLTCNKIRRLKHS